jgi:hypothetical protein
MHIEEDQSIIFILTLLFFGTLLIKTPAGFALIGISLFFLYKKLSGS